MKLSDKQRFIIQMLHDNNGEVTKKQCVKELKYNYYSNAEKYIGEILATMVKQNILVRVKPGVFKLGEGKKLSKFKPYNEGQFILI